MENKFASRKFILTCIILVSISLLFIFGKLSEDGFLNTLMTLYGIYVGGNITTKFLKRGGNNGGS